MRRCVATVGLVLLGSLACGGGSTAEDETGWSSGCTGEIVKPGRPLLLGTVEELDLVRAAADEAPLVLESDRPDVVAVASVLPTCRGQLGLVGTSTRPCAVVRVGWRARIEARGVGRAVLRAPERPELFDDLPVVVEQARSLRVSSGDVPVTALELEEDTCASLSVSALGADGQPLQASRGFRLTIADRSVAGPSFLGWGVCARGAGATSLTVTATGASLEIPLRVVERL